MNLSQPAISGHCLFQPPEQKNDSDSSRESQKQPLVLSIDSKDLDRTDGAPEYRCSEESRGARTGESHWCCRSADIFNINLFKDDISSERECFCIRTYLELHYTNADNGGDESSQHLTCKSNSRWNLDGN